MANPAEQLQPEDVFGMSDDELSNLDLSSFEDQGGELDQEQPDETGNEDDQDPENDPESDNPDESNEGTDPEDGGEADGADPENDNPDAEGTQDNPDEGSDAPNFEELYRSIVGKTFRANGRDVTIETPEEAIKMIQFGMNYHEKMAVIKPVRRTAKMLEQAGLLDEDKLGFLIDLHNKKPEAIARYLRDNEIDVHDIDMDIADTYQNTNKAPTDEQMALNDVVAELSAEENFRPMLDGILGQWDQQSQTFIGNNPEILNILQQHNRDGDYDAIMNAVARERMFNPALANEPVLKTYRDCEVKLREGNALPSLKTQVAKPAVPLATAAELIGTKPATNTRRKAAVSPRKAPATADRVLSPEEIFALSDEEFAKIASTKN